MLFAVALVFNANAQSGCLNSQDANQDGLIGVEDLMDLLSHWQDTDFDFDGVYDSMDLCTDDQACNYVLNPTEPCEYLDVLGVCGGDCLSDEDGDGVCNEFAGPCQGEVTLTYQDYTYDLVEIGGQCWFAENLRTELYQNGDSIPGGLTDDEWTSTTEGAQSVFGEGSSEVYNGSSDEAANLETYGRLYNWHAVDDSRGLCPSGWHAPTDGEFMTLEITLGMSESEVNLPNFRGTDQGTQMKSSPEDSPSWDGTNTSGFSALASGQRHRFSHFNYQGSFGTFWSSTAFSNINRSWVRELHSGNSGVWRGYASNQYGFSVRCLKDPTP